MTEDLLRKRYLSRTLSCIILIFVVCAAGIAGKLADDNTARTVEETGVRDTAVSKTDEAAVYTPPEETANDIGRAGVHAPGYADILSDMISAQESLFSTMKISGTDEDEALAALRPCVVRIQTDTERGSGVILDITAGEVKILTCRHVVSEDGIRITFFTGHEVDADILRIYEDRDAALLTVDTALLYPQELLVLRKIRRGDEPVRGDPVWYIASADRSVFERWSLDRWYFDLSGRDIDVGNHVASGAVKEPLIEVQALDRDMLYVDMAGVPGMSGGGVFNSAGELIGILVGGVTAGGIVAEPVGELY